MMHTLLTIEDFTQQLATELHALPGIASITTHVDTIELTLREPHDGKLIIRSGNFYRTYRRNGDLRGALAAAVANLREFVESRTQMLAIADDFEVARPRIFARLQPLVNMRKRIKHKGQEEKRLYEPWLADLAISYVLDFPRNVEYITERMLGRWQQDRATIRDLAMRNLRALALRDTPITPITPLPFGGRAYAIGTSDGYAATRLLLPDLVAQWTRPFIDARELRIALPHHDVLVAGAAGTDGHNRLPLEMLARALARGGAPYQLSHRLFTLRGGAVVEA